MKLIHMSDLHIGKRMYEFSLLEDQRYILAQALSIVEREKPDAVILAGDLYDKAVPPAEAVQVLDQFLTGLSKRVPAVFFISGNHDSAERLAFGASLMRDCGVYTSPVYDGHPVKVSLKDAYGTVQIHLLPFIRPAVVRHAFPEAEILTYQDAVRTAIEHMEINPEERNVLAAHQFVTGAGRCESEEIFVGGLDNIEVSLFEAFDYVALGHLHSPQHVGRETVRYCGTPLKYSFSEAGQQKSITVVELMEKGCVEIRESLLTPLREVRTLRGTYMEVTSKSFYEGMNLEDYVQITLTDEDDIPDGMQKLRSIYHNLMRLEYDNRRTREHRRFEVSDDGERKSEMELFEEFFRLQNNRPMGEEQRAFAGKLLQEIKEGQE